METPLIADLPVGSRFAGYLLVRSADVRRDKKGSLYLDMNLCDRSGEVNCKLWNSTFPAPAPGTVVSVRGCLEEFNRRIQFRVEKIDVASPQENVDMSRLVASAPEAPEAMRAEIDRTADAFASDALKAIVREMLRRADAEGKLSYYPAAQRIHHAERSGLLHHTISMLRLSEALITAYPYLNGDLLRAGVILHDLAKIDEMQSDMFGNVSDYTMDGLLIGHLVRGVANLQEAAATVGVTGEIVTLLQHMLISHHGQPDFGSPKLPMFPEAEALHLLDLTDARLNEMESIMRKLPAGAFSEKLWTLDRRMYHPEYDFDAPRAGTPAAVNGDDLL